MLPPHELKNKEFPKVMRGYSTVDVDEHIEFIIEKYTELYRANDELERRIQQAEADLKEFKADEESIRSALVNAQRASSKIISEANERADVILRSAKTNCDKIISEFNTKILEEREVLIHLRNVVAEFKRSLFNKYTSHIEYIETIAPELDVELDEQIENADYTKLVVERIKKDITSGIVQEYGDTLPKSIQEHDPEPEPINTIAPPDDVEADADEYEDDEDDDDNLEETSLVEAEAEAEADDEDFDDFEEELSLDFDDMVSVIPKKDSKKIDQDEQERLEQEEIERQKIEQRWLEQERIKQEKLEQEKLELEKLEQEKLEWEKLERRRLEREKLELEKAEKEKQARKLPPKPEPEPEPEPKFEVERKPAVPESSGNKPLSMKERIKLLNKKFDETEENDISAKENSDNFDDDYDDFVKSMEVNKKKKNKPRSADDDK